MSQRLETIIAGRSLTIETGKLAQQADGAVTVSYGDTVVLVTACASEKSREGVDFVPLTVDYEERLYAAGKIPGSFIRRESRPSEEATLASRLTDRPLRPLFPKNWYNDVQIIITVLSADQENDPDILAIIGASAALILSEIPFSGPVSAVRIGYLNGNMIINPTLPQLTESLLDLVIASTKEAVVMVEAGAKEVSESLLLEAIELGHKINQEAISLQERLQKSWGKPKKEIESIDVNSDLITPVSSLLENRLIPALDQPERWQREEAVAALKKEAIEKLTETFSEAEIDAVFEAQIKAGVRKIILEQGRHIDGRSPTELRPINGEVGLLPRTHGSGLFTRGQTQVLTITTLGSAGEEQLLDGLGLAESKRFMHHYNFPPFSTGEVKRLGAPGRREIGHGALVERAITPVLPSQEDFPYTIRLVSEVLSSNGSTSMASTCSSSLSLMDAGIPIKAPVAGVAIGLVTGQDNSHVILTDIEGMEDAYGDMDLKVAGTTAGITALQLDVKIPGISFEIVSKALNQARDARLEILERMRQIISSSRSELSRYAPRMYKITIDPNKIGTVIGPGGKTIRSIIEETKVSIDVGNDGTVLIGSPSEEAAQRAIKIIEGLTQEVEVGSIYTGKVTRLLNFGAMVEILPGKEGLVHISELADHHVPKVRDVVKVGDEIMVKVIEIDRLGRINLSRRAVFEDLSRMHGAKVKDSLASHYPAKKRQKAHSTPHIQKGNRNQSFDEENN